jgi:hypothetical protein
VTGTDPGLVARNRGESQEVVALGEPDGPPSA